MIKKFIFLYVATPFLCAAVSFGEGHLKKASFMPLWSPQAQFAGYYVAYEKGIFRNHGLDITILSGGPNNNPVKLLKSGKADFVVLWLSAAIRERSLGAPLVNIAQANQRSSLMLIAKKSGGINSPSDLNGKKVSYWEGDLSIQPKAFISKYNLKVTMIPQTYTVNLFLRGGVDAISAMWYNEYHTVINSGVNQDELTAFFYDEHGLNFPEDGIYALESTTSRDPELCRAFVQASLEGWEYAFAHEEETLDIILKYMKKAGLPANKVHQQWMLRKMNGLMMPGGDKSALGALKEEDYERVVSEMLKAGAVKSAPEYIRFYRPAGLQQ